VDPVTGQEFHLVECRCGMAFVNPMPVPECIPQLYPDDYLKNKADMETRYRRMMKFLPKAGNRLLDIGCGRGDFIRYASGQGWTVEGVDLIPWNGQAELPIRVGDFPEMDISERSYDAVTAWALLEHVRWPSRFFGKVSGILKKEGQFTFVVPNFRAPGIRHSCSDDIPRHLWLFTPRAVVAYLDRFGMVPRSITHDASIYTAYPFGLLRYAFLNIFGTETRLCRYENKAVALLRNRQIQGNLTAWLRDVVTTLGPVDLVLDAVDGTIGICVANLSKLLGNYGVITVVAGLK
jgi:SAM-dependent methyltransferase